MQVVLSLRLDAGFAIKGQAEAAKHVESGEGGGEGSQPEQHRAAERAFVSPRQNLILAEETCAHQGDTADGDGGNQKRGVRGFQLCRSPPILRMSSSPLMACITLPAARKSSDLKNA